MRNEDSLFTVWPDGVLSLLQPTVLAGLSVSLLCTRMLRQYRCERWTSPQAWLRAFQYFGLAFVVSSLCGVWPALLTQNELISANEWQSTAWRWLTGLWLLQVVYCYGFVWSLGTFTDGRPRRPFSSLLFGFCWGVSHSQVFLCIWALVELSGLGRLWVAVISFGLISAFNAAWHALYWDEKVSPPHNREEWNTRKVLYCHVPNLMFAVAHLALFENPLIFVAVQTLALMISAYIMRFPAWNYACS